MVSGRQTGLVLNIAFLIAYLTLELVSQCFRFLGFSSYFCRNPLTYAYSFFLLSVIFNLLFKELLLFFYHLFSSSNFGLNFSQLLKYERSQIRNAVVFSFNIFHSPVIKK